MLTNFNRLKENKESPRTRLNCTIKFKYAINLRKRSATTCAVISIVNQSASTFVKKFLSFFIFFRQAHQPWNGKTLKIERKIEKKDKTKWKNKNLTLKQSWHFLVVKALSWRVSVFNISFNSVALSCSLKCKPSISALLSFVEGSTQWNVTEIVANNRNTAMADSLFQSIVTPMLLNEMNIRIKKM